jgi:signal peptidase II
MYKLFSFVTVFLLALDQLSKQLVLMHIPLGTRVVLLPSFLSLTHVRNTGAAFGWLAGKTIVFYGAVLLIVAAVVYFRHDIVAAGNLAVISTALMMAGALGNMIDRLRFQGEVVDFISFSFFPPVFNVADSALVIGAGLLLLSVLRLELS